MHDMFHDVSSRRPHSGQKGQAMKYLVRKSIVQIIGRIWMPPIICAQEKILSGYDIENIRDRVEPGITRRNVEDWLGCSAGDFQSVDDFSASIEDGDTTVDIGWESEESEFTYSDCMYAEA